MENREEILNEIVERELAMFLATPNEGGTADCQQRPDTFRLMRQMAHSAHTDSFLQSYLEDLRAAEKNRRNFMIEKYALMDGRIPPLSTNPLLDVIADAETEFIEEAAKLYPQTIKRNGSDIFRRYLRSELQTLSQRSLETYANEIAAAKAAGRNPVVERYDWLARKLGKKPLIAPEARQ